MKNFYVWYDNGGQFFEAQPGAFPVRAVSAEEALELAGGPRTPWGTPRVVTASADDNPNLAR